MKRTALDPTRSALRFAGAAAAGFVVTLVSAIVLLRLGYVIGMAPLHFAAIVVIGFVVTGWLLGAALQGGRRGRIGFALGGAVGLTPTVVPLFAIQGFSGQQSYAIALILLYGAVGAVGFAIMGAIGGAFLGRGWRGVGSCSLRLGGGGAFGGGVAGAFMAGGVAWSYGMFPVLGAASFYLLSAATGGWLLARGSSGSSSAS